MTSSDGGAPDAGPNDYFASSAGKFVGFEECDATMGAIVLAAPVCP